VNFIGHGRGVYGLGGLLCLEVGCFYTGFCDILNCIQKDCTYALIRGLLSVSTGGWVCLFFCINAYIAGVVGCPLLQD